MSASLLTFLVTVAGVLGLVIGSFLNVVAYRVPAGIPLNRESRCPQCDAPVRWWHNVPVLGWLALRGRCPSCQMPISVRHPLVEAFTGLAFGAVTWLFLNAAEAAPGGDGSVASPWSLAVIIVAYLYFLAVSIVLTLIDFDTHRLPNVIVLPSYLVAIALFTAACLLGADWSALLRAGAGMAVLYLFYFVLRLARPDGMGGGDVKLAGVVGLYLGWLGWGALAVGAFAAFLLGGIFGIALLLGKRAGRRTSIPFGPWMLAGAWFGIFAGEIIGRLYGSLYAVS